MIKKGQTYKIKKLYVKAPKEKELSTAPYYEEWLWLLHGTVDLIEHSDNIKHEYSSLLDNLLVAEIEKSDGTTEMMTLIYIVVIFSPCKNFTKQKLRKLILNCNPICNPIEQLNQNWSEWK